MKEQIVFKTRSNDNDVESPIEVSSVTEQPIRINVCQYSVGLSNTFKPTTTTISRLPSGIYIIKLDSSGDILFEKKEQNIGELIIFKNSIADKIISEFDSFWKLKEKYLKMGEVHKRGYLLHGPPGGGKTSLVEIIKSNFVNDGNIVIDFTTQTLSGIKSLRQIEPTRKILVCIEDIDSWIHNNDYEAVLLNFLDGDSDFNNIVIIATTNYPELLPDRIINRPSRFDRVEYIGFPDKQDRKIYLKNKANCINGDMSKWLDVTENWTFAHIKELVLATQVYGLDFNTTVDRINKMRKKEESSKIYERKLRGEEKYNPIGF